MQYQLDLTLRRAEGALARVIGTAERRGFRPISVDDPDKDYEAVMSSRAELWRRSPPRRSGAGPHPGGDARSTPVVC